MATEQTDVVDRGLGRGPRSRALRGPCRGAAVVVELAEVHQSELVSVAGEDRGPEDLERGLWMAHSRERGSSRRREDEQRLSVGDAEVGEVWIQLAGLEAAEADDMPEGAGDVAAQFVTEYRSR